MNISSIQADGPGLQNAPDIWEILRDLVGGNPWLVLLISLLSWGALLYGLYKTYLKGVSRADDLLRRLAAHTHRRSIVVRFAAASLLALIPVGWVILAIPWGNVLLHLVLSVLGWHDDLDWFTLSPGSVVGVCYALFAAGSAIEAYLTGDPEGWLRFSVAMAVPPAVPIGFMMCGPLPFWLTFAGVSFLLGFVVAPATIIGCIRLCDLRQLTPRPPRT
jgi:hypothetical protein